MAGSEGETAVTKVRSLAPLAPLPRLRLLLLRRLLLTTTLPWCDAQEPPILGSCRLVVWWLCAIPWLACHCVRRGLPLMIEFIVRDMGFTEFQKAQLLGAFFPIYSISIIPAAAVAKIVGGKATLNVSLFGQALCLMLLPVAARAGGQRAVYLMCACMGGLGVLQGPLIPGLAPIEAAWIPQGPSRALALRIPHMGMRFHFLGTIAIPMLATSRFGWRAAPICFGVGCGLLGCLWNFWAANTPAEWRGPPKMKDDEKALFGLDKKPEGTGEETPAKKSGALATYFFRCGRGYLPMLGHSILAVIGAQNPPCFRFLSLRSLLLAQITASRSGLRPATWTSSGAPQSRPVSSSPCRTSPTSARSSSSVPSTTSSQRVAGPR